MIYRRKIILIVLAAIGFFNLALGVEHDHQPWDLVDVGRLVAVAWLDHSEGDQGKDTLELAKSSALATLEYSMDALECINYSSEQMPEVNLVQFPNKDEEKFLMVGVKDISCSYSLRQQLFPIEPSNFRRICDRVDWKCDIIWIPDGDTTVWYVNRSTEIPPRIVKKY